MQRYQLSYGNVTETSFNIYPSERLLAQGRILKVKYKIDILNNLKMTHLLILDL